MLAAEPQSEFIFEHAAFQSCHASTIVETAPGEYLSAWFGGTAEGRPDVAIWAARKTRGRWSAPAELAREQDIATYNPVLFHTRDGVLWLYYKFGPSPASWSAARRSSRDEGRTWSKIEHLPAGLYGPIKNKPLVLEDGTVVSGTSVESHRTWAAWIERSTDHGKSWNRHGPIVPGIEALRRPGSDAGAPQVPGSELWKDTFGMIQPAIVPLGPGHLRLFARATQNIGRICYSDSYDNGVNWSPARPTTLPNPNSGIDAVGLKDGRIVLVYNHTDSGRSPLNVAVSRDGERWNVFLTLEREPGEFSYPAIIQCTDGVVHITYTWKRERIKHVELPLQDIP